MTARPSDSTVAYSDGLGYLNLYCLRCPRPESMTVELNVKDVDPMETCTHCGRHVIDVAIAVSSRRLGPPPKGPTS